MTIGTVLLSKDNFYIGTKGELPARPDWDKDFITNLIKGRKVLCSKNTLVDLPKSILDSAYFTTNPTLEHDINFGISSFKYKPDILIVVRSNENLNAGKLFRLNDYTLIHCSTNMEVYNANKSS